MSQIKARTTCMDGHAASLNSNTGDKFRASFTAEVLNPLRGLNMRVARSAILGEQHEDGCERGMRWPTSRA